MCFYNDGNSQVILLVVSTSELPSLQVAISYGYSLTIKRIKINLCLNSPCKILFKQKKHDVMFFNNFIFTMNQMISPWECELSVDLLANFYL